MTPLKKFNTIYLSIAITLFNVLLCFIAINIGLLALSPLESSLVATPTYLPTALPFRGHEIDNFDLMRNLYPGRSDAEIVNIRIEAYNITFICDADTGYREQPYMGKSIRIAPEGYRYVDGQAPFPPSPTDTSVFLFGGSTVMGFNEDDENTLASLLQYYLRRDGQTDRIAVYNFARSGYFSQQEAALFDQLLAQGIVPDVAIFMDGLNEFYHWDGKPKAVGCADAAFKWNNTLLCSHDELCLPIQQAATNLGLFTPIDLGVTPPAPSNPPPNDDLPTIEVIIQRWLTTKASIEASAAAHGVTVLFVIQPVPVYHYNLDYHFLPRDRQGFGPWERNRYGYPVLNQRLAENQSTWGSNVLNLSEMADSLEVNLYLDIVHYSGYFMDLIAQQINQHLQTHYTADLIPD